MKRAFIFLLFLFTAFALYAKDIKGAMVDDTSEVVSLNKQALANRLTNPQQTLSDAERAMDLARKINFNNGIAEAYRVRGLALFYMDQPEKAFTNYLNA